MRAHGRGFWSEGEATRGKHRRRGKAPSGREFFCEPEDILDAKITRANKHAVYGRTLRNVCATAALIYLVFGLVFGLGWVSGSSMYPTIKDGSFAVFNRVDRDFRVGDIVVYEHSYGDLRVKRVVGVGGDVLNINAAGEITINGAQPPYDTFFETDAVEGGVSFPYTVPEDAVMLVGDKRDTSYDDRYTGATAAKEIKGKVLFVMQ